VEGSHGYLKTPSASLRDVAKQHRQVRDMEEYRRLAGDRRRALRFDKRQWAESIALEGEAYLQGGQIRDAFANFKRLHLNQMKISSPLLSADGNNLL